MAKRSPIDELDLSLEAMLARPDFSMPAVGTRQVTLLRVAAALRGFPSEDFKARLKSDLLKGGTMATAGTKIDPVRKGFHTITPYLSAVAGMDVVNFVKQAFGAEELFRARGGAGGYHCEVRIGDSMMMIGGGGDFKGPDRPGAILLTVDDADATYRRAIQAGATSLYEPVNQFYGDREAGVKDVGGNSWYITTRRVSEHSPADTHTVTPGLAAKGAARLVDFLKAAFGATEAFRANAPDGTLGHARMRIGDSLVSIGEARGEFLPTKAGFYMYVPDADALYHRSIKAGATVLYEIADQPYGDRLGGVTDPFGNEWYIATHIKDMTA